MEVHVILLSNLDLELHFPTQDWTVPSQDSEVLWSTATTWSDSHETRSSRFATYLHVMTYCLSPCRLVLLGSFVVSDCEFACSHNLRLLSLLPPRHHSAHSVIPGASLDCSSPCSYAIIPIQLTLIPFCHCLLYNALLSYSSTIASNWSDYQFHEMKSPIYGLQYTIDNLNIPTSFAWQCLTRTPAICIR